VAQANVKLTVNATQATSALKGVQNQTKLVNSGVNRLKTAIAGVGITVLARQAIQTSANFEKLNVRLGLLTKASGTFARSQELAAQAQRAFGLSATEALEGITDITARLQPLGVGVEDIKTTFFGFNTAAKLAGASAIESSNAFRQLAQALGSGRLQGDEFRSISEQIPTILKPVADELGTTVGELKKFSSEGKITSGVVIRALKKIETEGGASLAALLKNDPTQVFKNLSNETENLSRAFGDKLSPAILPVIRAITKLTQEFTDFVNSPAGTISLLFAGIGVAIKGVTIAIPILSAQVIAIKANFAALTVGAKIFTGQLIATKATLAATSVGFATATAAANAFKIALIKTGIGAAVIVLGHLAAKFLENKTNADAAAKAAKEFDNNIKGITESADNSALALNELTISQKEFELSQLGGGRSAKGTEKRLLRELKVLKERNKILKGEDERKAQQKLNKSFNDFTIMQLKSINNLERQLEGKTDEETLQDRINELKKKFGEEDSKQLIELLKKEDKLKKQVDILKEQREEAKKLKEVFASIGEEIETSIKDNLREAITGAQSFGQAMTNVLNRIRDKIIDAQLDRLIGQFGENFGKSASKRGSGSGIGGFVGNILGGLFGRRANGGPVAAGKSFVVGEKGPEILTMGSSRGFVTANDKIGGGSVSNMVTVNVDASGSSVSGNNADAQALGAAIGAAVQAQLIKEKRPGGILTR